MTGNHRKSIRPKSINFKKYTKYISQIIKDKNTMICEDVILEKPGMKLSTEK